MEKSCKAFIVLIEEELKLLKKFVLNPAEQQDVDFTVLLGQEPQDFYMLFEEAPQEHVYFRMEI